MSWPAPVPVSCGWPQVSSVVPQGSPPGLMSDFSSELPGSGVATRPPTGKPLTDKSLLVLSEWFAPVFLSTCISAGRWQEKALQVPATFAHSVEMQVHRVRMPSGPEISGVLGTCRRKLVRLQFARCSVAVQTNYKHDLQVIVYLYCQCHSVPARTAAYHYI